MHEFDLIRQSCLINSRWLNVTEELCMDCDTFDFTQVLELQETYI